jgi:hypothetical protein
MMVDVFCENVLKKGLYKRNVKNHKRPFLKVRRLEQEPDSAEDIEGLFACRLKAIQAALLLFFADGVHTLLKVCSGNFCIAPLLSFLLNLKHTPSVLLV